MKTMRNVGKAVEAGVMLVAVSALLLAGCGGGGGGSRTTATPNAFVTALTDGVGLRSLMLEASPVRATVVMATAGPSGSYSLSGTEKALNGNAWQTYTPVVTDYFLSHTGTWYDNTTGDASVTVNSDGTLNADGDAVTMVSVDLSNANIKTGARYRLVNPAITGGSAVVSVGAMPISSASAVYPAGSTAWIGVGLVYSMDQYQVGAGTSEQIKTPSGDLATLDFGAASTYISSNPLCLPSGAMLVYSVTQPAPTNNTAHFDVYLGSCAAISSGTLWGAVDLTYKTVLGQSIAQFSNYTGGLTGVFSETLGGVVEPAFVAVVNNKVRFGHVLPARSSLDAMNATRGTTGSANFNKTAMDAVTAAAGLPSF